MSNGKFSFLNALVNILILTVILWSIFFAVQQINTLSPFIHHYYHEMIIYSAVVALVVAYFSYFNINSGGPAKYVTVILGSTVIRMILSLVIFLIFLLRGPENRLILVINFLIVYLSYLLFEIYSIITNLRRISKKGNS
jgi:Co/Zn/Cd efflux system component